MSEEMAVSDIATADDANAQSEGATTEIVTETPEAPSGELTEATTEDSEEAPAITEDVADTAEILQLDAIKKEQETVTDSKDIEQELKNEVKETEKNEVKETDKNEVKEAEAPAAIDIKNEFEMTDNTNYPPDEDNQEIKHKALDDDDDADFKGFDDIKSEEFGENRGVKRRASEAFSDDDVEFKGFADIKNEEFGTQYSLILERLEAEVTAATKDFVPVRTVVATPTPGRACKRPRNDTDGSRPSSALSSRSEGDDVNPSASPAHRGRRTTSEISSPLLRIPLERGWKRELVYRAALDIHSRRNADIYYYTPYGKKLRSTREVGEHLSGTGLTLENFSFFKEPLGVDDPEKEIIRDAKLMRRVDSPIASPAPAAVEGKRTPKPKHPKGVSPEPATPKSPPAKLRVKSVGSRLSASTPTPAKKKPSPPPVAPTPPAPVPAAPDNNNSAAWKKPRAPPAAPPAVSPAAPSLHQEPPQQKSPPRLVTPPPLVSKPPPQIISPVAQPSPRQLVQPCSMSCGAGVPSLSCSACLCMYHPACVGFKHSSPHTFLCKNCRKSTSPPRDPPPLTHKSGITTTGVAPPMAVPTPRRLPAPQTNTHKVNDKRVLLRMKVSGGTDGERVWAVAQPRGPAPRVAAPAPGPAPRLLAVRGSLPQSLAVINGRRFIIVPRAAPLPTATTAAKYGKSRVTNGGPTPTPMAAVSPRRRGRPRADPKEETDHFTAFYERAKDTNLVVQIFQYLGMRDLAHCARVCRMWKELAATPALWRHVRMKNSQVNDWGGLCAALKRHGTKWLDLRKMLLPQNDVGFWDQFAQHIANVDTLERLEMCRCPARAVESASATLPALRSLSALAIKDATLDPTPLAKPRELRELRLKSMQGLALTADLTPLASLKNLRHLSLTSIKELGWRACDVVGELPNLESLELGECTFREEFGSVLARLHKLGRLRLERGTAHCAAPALLRSLAHMPRLTRLELVNIDVKVGFDDALAECKNIQRLLIIPTYVSQSATTNKQVLSGVLRLKDTLTHLMWGVTIELLRVTELFIDQCSAGGATQAKRESGECIPVLKPVPGCRLPMDHQLVAGPPQVEILPLPTLQRLLSAQLPNTKLKLLRIPFHATWRQSLADFQ